MIAARTLATYADLRALAEDVRAEIFDGEIVASPPPAPEHGRAQGSLSHYLGGPFDYGDGRGGPGGWWIMPEVDVALSAHDIVRPDLIGYRRERLASPWGARPLRVLPDWVCEIVSSSRPAQDRVKKRAVYSKYGVPFYWIVDPDARTLEALRLDPETRAWIEVGAYDDASVARIAPFEAVELEVGRIFAPRAAENP